MFGVPWVRFRAIGHSVPWAVVLCFSCRYDRNNALVEFALVEIHCAVNEGIESIVLALCNT